MGFVTGNNPPWFITENEGDPPHGLQFFPFKRLALATCPLCRTGGSDPDRSDTFVDAVLPDSADPGLTSLFEGANIDVQFDYSFTNNPDHTEEWDVCVAQTSPTRKSVFHVVHKINVDGETTGTISLPTLDTSDQDKFGAFPPFQLGGVTSRSDDPDKRWGRGYVWRDLNSAEPLTSLAITEQTSRHEETRYSLVTDCTSPGATQPSDPADADDDYDITGHASIHSWIFNVCRTDDQFKLSMLAYGTIAINGNFPGDSTGIFSQILEFWIYTGDWTAWGITPSMPDANWTLSGEEELASEIFGATVKWRHTTYSRVRNTHEIAVGGTCAMAGGSETTHKITLWEGESSMDISNMIVTASLLP